MPDGVQGGHNNVGGCDFVSLDFNLRNFRLPRLPFSTDGNLKSTEPMSTQVCVQTTAASQRYRLRIFVLYLVVNDRDVGRTRERDGCYPPDVFSKLRPNFQTSVPGEGPQDGVDQEPLKKEKKIRTTLD